MKRFTKIALLIVAVAFVLPLSAQNLKRVTYDEIANWSFYPRSVWGVRSMKSGENYTTIESGKVVKYSYSTGERVETIFDPKAVSPEIRFDDYQFSEDESKILFTTDSKYIYRRSFTAKYWIYDIAAKTLTAIADGSDQEVASFSPDATKVAFVRANNLFYFDIASATETQITTDGRFNYIINGKSDWVYEEEFEYSKAYEWSPDSQNIAYYRFDEERVKEYHMNRFDGELYPTVYSFKYPKAGEQNSIVSVYNYNLAAAVSTHINVGDEDDQYIARLVWNGKDLMIFRRNRLQNRFDILKANVSAGTSKVVFTETNSRYVERLADDTITFLSDGDRFILKSEKEGFWHLYLYSITKGELNRITSGKWDVTEMLGVSADGTVFYMSAETSPLRRNLYSIDLKGKKKSRLTISDGMYSVDFNSGMSYYISYFSNTTTPTLVTLHRADGRLVRVLEGNAEFKARMAEYAIPQKEFIKIKTEKGIELNAYIIKPVDFDPNKKYPLFMTQYSGPGSQEVNDSWRVSWEYALVNEGYIVACVDPRGTGFRGEEFKKCTYLDLGKYEVIDQADAARYLGKLPYIDASRIGIYGWSYGGFMSLNCILKYPDVFSLAIAVAPVTNWRYYDSIYTEVYNGLPQDNPSGYDDNSPLNFADGLEGKLLIIHGTADDNVHPQNSYEMVSSLVDAGKPFDMMLYTDKNHSMLPGRSAYNHLIRKCIEYIKDNL